jgi:hypothetical protein
MERAAIDRVGGLKRGQMSENRAEPETEIVEAETYEPPEVTDYGRLVDLTLSGNNALTDAAGFATASAAGGS